MKKYLMMGAAALAVSSAFVGCSKEKDLYDPTMNAQQFLQNYQQAFIQVFGQPAANQTWGFGQPASARMTRSAEAPSVAGIDAPFDEAWVAEYLTTAKEADYNNTRDNYDNTTYATNYGEGGVNSIDWNAPEQVKDRNYFFGDDGNTDSWETRLAWALEHHPSWLTFSKDETYVTNFKITGIYSDFIEVAASEGLTDQNIRSNAERTIVVTGTWNITTNQAIGSLGKIIIANGGVVNVQSGVKLDMNNEARLVVLSGGKLTGEGLVQVNNGNAVGEENYNGGTIDVAQFNNNFGKFYNYGKFLVNEYNGGAQESNFYNHALASIDHFTSTANARIFNGCQFYVKNDARIRNYEGVAGSALIVGGQLLFSGSEDGTKDPTYVGLAAGALVQAGSLYNNGTSWVGPTENGYAVLNIGQFDFMNWVQDAPQNGGYFANNIYLVADVLDNVPDGNGMQQKTDDGTEYYTMSKADWKFENVVANAVGNGNVTIAEKGDYEVIPADNDFKLGEAGCTPGFKIKKQDPTPVKPFLRVIAEDLTVAEAGDFDFNDVVFDVEYVSETQAKVTIQAAGGTLPLYVDGKEVHSEFAKANPGASIDTKTMINTNAQRINPQEPYSSAELENLPTFTVNGTWHNTQEAFAADVNTNIIVKVIKTDEEGNSIELPLTAETGKTPGKVGVPSKTYQWKDEKVYVGDNFKKFVSDPNYKWWE